MRFNYWGLLFIALIMVPNIIFAVKCKGGFENRWKNRWVEALEQTGRFGCFIFMIFNIPCTCLGFCNRGAWIAYLTVNTVLTVLYCLLWGICFRKSGMFRALSLSAIPAVLFLFSGIISRSLLLTVFAVIFAPCHILISYKNARR